MTSIHVTASREYDVLIDSGLLDMAGAYIAPLVKGRRALIVSDDVVYPLYGARLSCSLEAAGFEAGCFIVENGERAKSLENFGRLHNFLSESRLGRSDTLIALGGGVVGDLTGFVASTYQRGMNFVQLPTTLLAAVDSSVGGKTALNLPSAKNQVGSFYQPVVVICDTDTLKSLPDEQYINGCAEVIKYGLLGSAEFFAAISAKPINEQYEYVIKSCVEMKRDIVNKDEYDLGIRQLLNLGHSFGHAIEACSGFEVLHGQAVAIGMAVISRAAVSRGICTQQALNELLDILDKYGLPSVCDYPLDRMYTAVLADKKLSADKINLIVPESIGKCRIESVAVSELKAWMKAGGIV